MGEEHGLTAVEMNILLKEEGFLEGSPNAYRVTPKGEPFASERIEGRGTGGYLHMNPSWGVRTWDPAIEDQLNITPERKRVLREAAAEQRRQIAHDRAAKADAVETPRPATNGSGADETNIDVVKAIVVIGALAAAAWGTWKAAPHLKRLWRERARPGIDRRRDRARRGRGSDPEADGSSDTQPD
jgi:hypothetical protein